MNYYFRTKILFEKSVNPVESLTSTSLPVKFTIVDMAEHWTGQTPLSTLPFLTANTKKCSLVTGQMKVFVRIGTGRKN